MPILDILVTHDVGLHARPAAQLVQTAQRYDAEIELAYAGRQANAKSLISVMALGANQGAQISIDAQGDDADQALQALKTLIEHDFET